MTEQQKWEFSQCKGARIAYHEERETHPSGGHAYASLYILEQQQADGSIERRLVWHEDSFALRGQPAWTPLMWLDAQRGDESRHTAAWLLDSGKLSAGAEPWLRLIAFPGEAAR